MRPDESFVSQPVRSLQTMLHYIARNDPAHKSLVPDGIYGPQTTSAVAQFQRLHGIPVTGVADQHTWDRIHEHYRPARVHQSPAQPLQIVLNPNQIIRRGETHPNVRLAQAILYVLSDVYGGISAPSFTGIIDEPTYDSISSFQLLNDIPMTGELDKLTWKGLALHYPLASNLLITRG